MYSYCSQVFLGHKRHFKYQLILHLVHSCCAYCGLASSRPAPFFFAILSHITPYATVIGVKPLFQRGARTRNFRGDVFEGAWSSYESQDCWTWNIVGRVITTQAVASAGQFVPARELGSSKGPRGSETAQAVASAGQFVSSREPGLNKGPRRSETAQAVAPAEQFVPTREPGSRKGPRHSETTAQAEASAGKFVPAREHGSRKAPRRSEVAQAVALVEVRACQRTRVE